MVRPSAPSERSVRILVVFAVTFLGACGGTPGGNGTPDAGDAAVDAATEMSAAPDGGGDVEVSGPDAAPDEASAVDAGNDAADAGNDVADDVGGAMDAGGDDGMDAAGDRQETGGSPDAGPTMTFCPGGVDSWVGDFDGDGIDDCAHAQSGTTKLSVVFHKGVAPSTYLVAGVVTADILETSHSTVGVFDLNHDGRKDIIVGMDDPLSMPTMTFSFAQIFRGQVDGTFVPWAIPPGAPSNVTGLGGIAGFFRVSGFQAGDFDGDGYPDMAVVTAQPTLFSHFFWTVLKSSGGLDFAVKDSDGIPSLRGVATIDAAADLNHDGKLDIVITLRANPVNSQVWQIGTALNNGDGTFGATTIVPGSDGNSGVSSVVIDRNGDGKLDLLVNMPAGPTIFYGDGAGNFSTTPPP